MLYLPEDVHSTKGSEINGRESRQLLLTVHHSNNAGNFSVVVDNLKMNNFNSIYEV